MLRKKTNVALQELLVVKQGSDTDTDINTTKTSRYIGTFSVYGIKNANLFIDRTQNTFHKSIQSFFFIHSALDHFMNFNCAIHIGD